jgi:hypothetical protein
MFVSDWVRGIRVFFDADAGGDGGGNPTGDPPNTKTYTEEQVQKMVQDRIKKLRTETSEKDKSIQQLQSEIAELQAAVAGSQQPDDDKHQQGRLELELHKLRQQLSVTQEQLSTEKSAREAAETKRRESERNQLIQSALADIQCTDPRRAAEYFRSRVTWDVDAEAWMYQTENGNLVEVQSGIAAETPDYWRPTQLRGGAGSSGKAAKREQINGELTRAREVLAQAKRAAAASAASPADLLRVQKAKQAVIELESQLSG